MADQVLPYSMKIVNLSEAKRMGLKYYFTGKPCHRGHITKRSVSGARCCECSRINSYERSQLPDVKEMNASNKKKPEYIEKQKEYSKKKRVEKGGRSEFNRKIDMDIPSESSEYHRIYYHIRKSEDENFGKVSEERKENRREYINRWTRDKRIKDPLQRSIEFMRKCISRILISKTDRTHEMLGYSPSDLKLHIEGLFSEGMSWENYGEWHIDHIVPISWFVLAGVNDPKVVNKLTNLQPLWAKENLSKGGVRRKKC